MGTKCVLLNVSVAKLWMMDIGSVIFNTRFARTRLSSDRNNPTLFSTNPSAIISRKPAAFTMIASIPKNSFLSHTIVLFIRTLFCLFCISSICKRSYFFLKKKQPLQKFIQLYFFLNISTNFMYPFSLMLYIVKYKNRWYDYAIERTYDKKNNGKSKGCCMFRKKSMTYTLFFKKLCA